MKILFLIQIFETHNDTGSDRHYYFAKKLVQEGHEVEVITANIDYKNAQKRFKNRSGVVRKKVDGITINYVPVYSNFRGSFFKRMIFFLSFFLSSTFAAIKTSQVSAVYSVSTPLTVGFLGTIISVLKRIPMVFEVTDVWPDAAIHTGVIENKFLIGIAKIMEWICYKSSSSIICLSSGIQLNIRNKNVPKEKTILIPNGVDISLFNKIDEDPNEIKEIRNNYQLGNNFIAMYLGAHGAYNSLFTILEAAKTLNNLEQVKIVFVGDGDEKRKLQKYVLDNNLTNVIFIGTVTRMQSIKLLESADIFLLPNRKGSFFECNLPNKLFDYLASARPILVSGYGETSEIIKKSESGIIVDAENSSAFSSSILELSKVSKEERIKMGKSGKEYVFSNYDRNKQSQLFIKTLKDSINKSF